jgi:hypothetical protein
MKATHSATSSDVLFSVPTYDDDNDSWYQETVWSHCTAKRTRYTISDSDGNHEPISRRDVIELSNQENQLWLEYSTWVVAHKGADPIGEFIVRPQRKIRRNYIAHFSHWIGESKHGLALDSVKWAKGVQKPHELPEPMQFCFCLKKVGNRWCMDGVTLDDLKDNVGYVGKNYFKGTAEWSEPLPDNEIRRRVLRLAKKHVAKAKAGAVPPTA